MKAANCVPQATFNIAATLTLLALQSQTDDDSKEKLLKKWNGQKLVRGSAWDKVKTSLCLIDCSEWTGTGCIGRKGGKLYLVTCWHNFAYKNSDSAEAILSLARQSKFQFSYIDEKDREWCLNGSTLLHNEMPVRPKVCANCISHH